MDYPNLTFSMTILFVSDINAIFVLKISVTGSVIFQYDDN